MLLLLVIQGWGALLGNEVRVEFLESLYISRVKDWNTHTEWLCHGLHFPYYSIFL
jgi:hypothetical protein